jgi:hypothetical protein
VPVPPFQGRFSSPRRLVSISGTRLSATAHSPGAVLDSDKLGFSAPSNAFTTATADHSASTGKKKFEVQVFTGLGGGLGGIKVGIADAAWLAAHATADGDSFFVSYDAGAGGVAFIGTVSPAMASGDWVSVMWDCDTGNITIRTPAGTYGPYGLGGAIGYSAPYFPVIRSGDPQGTSLRVNFGGAAWHYDDSASGYTVGF